MAPSSSMESAGQSMTNAVLMQYFSLISYVAGSDNNTKCFDGLGCIEISEKWYDLSRPINLLPLDREVVNTQFLLSTRDQLVATRLDLKDAQMVEDAGFKGDRPTKIIIHGFLDTGQEAWVKDMTSALLDAEDCNVIAIDWGGGSLPLYSQAAANTRLVGLEVANLIVVLVEEHQAYSGDFHIIGHSLGAHIAGYAGERIPGLGRISGLDPAEPLFQGMPPEVRLDPGDAKFVDVIHTDSKEFYKGGLGMEQPVGHVDFYPNGGKAQPGCSFLDFPYLPSINGNVEDITLPPADSVARNLFACGHNRVIDLYIDSILHTDKCPMVGHQCQDYTTFTSGDCYSCRQDGASCSVMGYGASKHSSWKGDQIQMFLDTDSSSPYCNYLYLVELDLASPKESETWVQGFLKVTLVGDKDSLVEYDLTPEESVKFFHGEMYKYQIQSPTDLGKVTVVQLYWSYDDQVKLFDLSRICLMFICSKHLYTAGVTVHSITNINRRVKEETLSVCGEEHKGLGYTQVTDREWN